MVSDRRFPAFVVLSGVNVPSPRRNLNKICGFVWSLSSARPVMLKVYRLKEREKERGIDKN